MASSAANLRQLVLNVVAKHPQGITCDAIEEITGLRHQTCSARVHELMKSGHILNSGRKAPTRSARGTKATLWILGSEGTVAAVAGAKAPDIMSRKLSTLKLHIYQDKTSSTIVDLTTTRAWVVSFCLSYLSAFRNEPLRPSSPFIVTDFEGEQTWVIPEMWFAKMADLHTGVQTKLLASRRTLPVTDVATVTQAVCKEVYRISVANKGIPLR